MKPLPVSIVLIAAGQPSSNPRLVKEAITLANRGYQITVLYCFWVAWADEADSTLFREHPSINWIRVGGHPVHQKEKYWFTRLRHKFFRIIASLFPGNITWQLMAGTRCFPELRKAAIGLEAKLYVAHNLGALAPAALAAKKNRSRYGLDAEDYYRGQIPEDDRKAIRAVTVIEDRYIPGTAFLTAASPLIAARYKELYPGADPLIVNNVFSIDHLQPEPSPYQRGETLKLFWFSQTVGTDRGLETVIAAIGRLKAASVTFTILGSCSSQERERLSSLAASSGVKEQQLNFLDPVAPDKIFALAASHHIGMATETSRTLNRRIALTNKIFTYPLGGLAIIATDIDSQRDFLQNYSGIGALYTDGDDQALASLLESYIANPGILNNIRTSAWNYAKSTLNWEKEQLGLVEKIGSVLKDVV